MSRATEGFESFRGFFKASRDAVAAFCTGTVLLVSDIRQNNVSHPLCVSV